ncbi:MAG: hypothetical protein ACREIT_00650 [Tepidisphaeraceae bacterium]
MSNSIDPHVPPDPLIDEIRAIRRELSERFDNDVRKLCDYLQEQERKHPERLVTPEQVKRGSAGPKTAG